MYIKRESAMNALNAYAQKLYAHNDWKMGETVDDCIAILKDIDEETVLPIEQYYKLNFECTVLKALLKGEWVKCSDVQEALNITFDQGMKMFQFGVGGPWNNPEDVRFRIGEKTLEQTKMKDFEEDFKIQEEITKAHSNPDTHQWEIILEQQGGII